MRSSSNPELDEENIDEYEVAEPKYRRRPRATTALKRKASHGDISESRGAKNIEKSVEQVRKVKWLKTRK